MKNEDVRIGITVKLKNIPGPTMIVMDKTPSQFGISNVFCMWFSTENVQQNSVFKANMLVEV